MVSKIKFSDLSLWLKIAAVGAWLSLTVLVYEFIQGFMIGWAR